MKNFNMLFVVLFMLCGMQSKASYDFYEDPNNSNASQLTKLALSIGGVVAFTKFASWLTTPTSENLFAIANELEKCTNQVVADTQKINKKEEAQGAFMHIKELMTKIHAITNKHSNANRNLRKVLEVGDALLSKSKRDFIIITADEDENKKITKVSAALDITEIRIIIQKIKEVATKAQQEEGKKTQNRWYNRAWRYVRGQKKMNEKPSQEQQNEK